MGFAESTAPCAETPPSSATGLLRGLFLEYRGIRDKASPSAVFFRIIRPLPAPAMHCRLIWSVLVHIVQPARHAFLKRNFKHCSAAQPRKFLCLPAQAILLLAIVAVRKTDVLRGCVHNWKQDTLSLRRFVTSCRPSGRHGAQRRGDVSRACLARHLEVMKYRVYSPDRLALLQDPGLHAAFSGPQR